MDSKIENIVDALIKKSDAGDVIWGQTSNKDGFKLQLKDSSLCVLYRKNDSRTMYTLWIYNSNGDMIVNESIDAAISPNKIRLLYETAKKVYYKKDVTLQSILEQLHSSDRIGEDDSLPF